MGLEWVMTSLEPHKRLHCGLGYAVQQRVADLEQALLIINSWEYKLADLIKASK